MLKAGLVQCMISMDVAVSQGQPQANVAYGVTLGCCTGTATGLLAVGARISMGCKPVGLVKWLQLGHPT